MPIILIISSLPNRSRALSRAHAAAITYTRSLPGNNRIRIARPWAVMSMRLPTFIHRHVRSFIPRLAIRRESHIAIAVNVHGTREIPIAHNRAFIDMLMITLAYVPRAVSERIRGDFGASVGYIRYLLIARGRGRRIDECRRNCTMEILPTDAPSCARSPGATKKERERRYRHYIIVMYIGRLNTAPNVLAGLTQYTIAIDSNLCNLTHIYV